jgi:putative transposase
MSFVNIYVHVVWATKKRKPLLEKPHRYEIFNHIRENARKKGIHLDHINGFTDHVHALISLGKTQNIAECVQLLKGECSYWVNNQTNLLKWKLDWAKDYYAVSVGESQVERVRRYIRNQELHHSKKSFNQECEEFVTIYGFTRIIGDD